MRFNTIGYCFKQGFKNIWRNKLFSLASMATMAACIFMFGIFFCMVQNFQHFVREAEEGVAVTVLFDVTVSRRLSMFQRTKHGKAIRRNILRAIRKLLRHL